VADYKSAPAGFWDDEDRKVLRVAINYKVIMPQKRAYSLNKWSLTSFISQVLLFYALLPSGNSRKCF
jgi:hypothetical protein